MPETVNSLQLSASSLQDFADCPRRFQLRHVQAVSCPVPVAEPVQEWEARQRQGTDFHRLAHQCLLDMSADMLEKSIVDRDVFRWWCAFREYVAGMGARKILAELALSIPFQGHRLVARYDALAMFNLSAREDCATPRPPADVASMVILDWKTYRRRPTRAWLHARLQTSVYRLVLADSGRLFGGESPIEPKEIELRYWLAEDPLHPEAFRYDDGELAADRNRVSQLVDDLDRLSKSTPEAGGKEVWPLTPDERNCRFCNFRTLCDREERTGRVDAVDGDFEEYAAGDDGETLEAQVAETAFWQG